MAHASLYFPDRQARDATMSGAAEVAARHGYTTVAGPKAGGGNIAELLRRIASGELATVLLSDEERSGAIEVLRHFASLPADEWPYSWSAREAFDIIADALEAARAREEMS